MTPAPRSDEGLRLLREHIRAEGGLLADALAPASSAAPAIPEAPQGPAQLAASGPRAAGRERDYELVVELIYEGYLAHYGEARALKPADQDLALLLGDQLYALGLQRLADLGDLPAIEVLADVISRAAQAQAEGEPARATNEWMAGARAVGWGREGVASPR